MAECVALSRHFLCFDSLETAYKVAWPKYGDEKEKGLNKKKEKEKPYLTLLSEKTSIPVQQQLLCDYYKFFVTYKMK